MIRRANYLEQQLQFAAPSPQFENVRLYRVRRDWFQLNACPIFLEHDKWRETGRDCSRAAVGPQKLIDSAKFFFLFSSGEKFYAQTYKSGQTLPGHSFSTRDYSQFIVELFNTIEWISFQQSWKVAINEYQKKIVKNIRISNMIEYDRITCIKKVSRWFLLPKVRINLNRGEH